MGRASTGQILTNRDGTKSVRVRIGPGTNDREQVRLPSGPETEPRAALVVELAARLRKVAPPEKVAKLLRYVAEARTAKGLSEAVGVCEDITAGRVDVRTSKGEVPTVAAFGEDWTSSRLHIAHSDHVKDKDSKRNEEIFRLYINPAIGSVRITEVTLDHAKLVMDQCRATYAPRSRLKVAQCLRKLLSLAVFPGEYITSNPIPREWMPKIPKSANKAKSCLYPSEDAALMGCTTVPLERRLAFGILDREGLRASELSGLSWTDLDLERGRVKLDVNKTDDPRAWALSPDVAVTLAWWKKRRPPEDETDRATFITIALANGKSETWVMDRTGHQSSDMVHKYRRQARTWSELELGTLGPLCELLPEVRLDVDWTLGSPFSDLNRRPALYETSEISGTPVKQADRDDEIPRNDPSRGGFGHPMATGSGQSERPDVASLERRIVAAEMAGRTVVADLLVRELEALRAATPAALRGTVVPFRRR